MLHKGNTGDQEKVKIVLRKDHPRADLSRHLGAGDASGRVKAAGRLSGASPSQEAGGLNDEDGSDSPSCYVSLGWQAGPGWAGRAGPWTESCLASGHLPKAHPEGLHPGRAWLQPRGPPCWPYGWLYSGG